MDIAESASMRRSYQLSYILFVCLFCCLYGSAQVTEHLTGKEIETALSSPPNSGFVNIADMSFGTPSSCRAQMPSESIFTPEGWLNVQNVLAKKQFITYKPSDDDTARVLRIISKGCASGSLAGPVCDTITRVVLLADKHSTDAVEAFNQKAFDQQWQNGFGASASCGSLISEFLMDDVRKIQKPDGSFVIATFSGAQLLKMYVVKQKYVKKLGL